MSATHPCTTRPEYRHRGRLCLRMPSLTNVSIPSGFTRIGIGAVKMNIGDYAVLFVVLFGNDPVVDSPNGRHADRP